MGIAHELPRTAGTFTGEARLFRLDPPMVEGDRVIAHVIVSKTVVPYSGPETYIFESDDAGKITNWLELEGSRRGRVSHAEALESAGYEIATTP